MDRFVSMAAVQAPLLIYLSLGYLARRLKIVTPEVRGGITKLIFYIFMPCTIFSSFKQDLDINLLLSSPAPLAVSACICLFSYILGKLIYNRYPAPRKKVLQFGTLVPNSVFAGMAAVKCVYGDLGVLYSSLFLIPSRIFMWSAAISFFADADLKPRAKKILLNPGKIAVVLGILRMLLKIKLPVFDTAVENLGLCTTPLSFMNAGSLLAEVEIRGAFSRECLYPASVRLILVPALVLLALRLISPDEVLRGTAVIMASMPYGGSATLIAQKYGADGRFASACVFLTTLLSLLTMPLISMLV